MKFKESGKFQCYVPKRYIFAAMSFMGTCSIFGMRSILSVAIVAMVNSTETVYSNLTNFHVECSDLVSPVQKTEINKFEGIQYNWDAQEQGLILGALYYGNIITQLPGGFLAEKLGAKWLFGGAILNTAIFSLLTPLIASCGVAAFVAVRIIIGLVEGVSLPALNLMISQWAPKMERSRLSTIIFTGTVLGGVFSMPIAGWLCSIDYFGGWPSVFYLFGSTSCIWFIFWAVLVHETPNQHPTISSKELQHFQDNEDRQALKKLNTPWKAIFSSLPMWAVLVAHTGCEFGLLLLLTDLPMYLSTALHFDIEKNGLLSALPFSAYAISGSIASYFADYLRKSGVLKVTNIRKIFNTLGFIGPALCLILITISGCRPYLIVSLLILAMALKGFVLSGFNVTHIDMSPTFAGTLYAITNAVANCCGFIAPALVAVFTDKGGTTGNWNKVFYVTAGIYAITAAFFAIFASAELQPWEKEKENTKPQSHYPVEQVTHM